MMVSMAEVLIIRGHMPITALDSADLHNDGIVEQFLAEGVITPAQAASARAEVLGLSFIELADYPVDPTAIALVPSALCRRHTVIPIHATSANLTLAMADPGDVLAVDDVRAMTRLNVVPIVAERSDLEAAINRYHRADGELTSLSTEIDDEATADVATNDYSDIRDDDAPIVRFVHLLINQAIQDRASDIHIEPTEKDFRVRYRIDGVLHEMQRAPKNIQNSVISRLKIMADIDIAERRKPQDGRLSVQQSGHKIDLRVATLPTVFGEKVVMRILDNSTTTLSMDSLDLMERNAAVFRESYTRPNGMILVTGPTGSGKSTTLYTTLHSVSRPEINVITVEDPVEYRMEGINQMQVNPKAGLTFASALRSILRADPDVVLIGEIRDHETAQIAIEASLTGHLVLSTLHTNDAPSALTRLIEMNIEPFLVGSALECVVAQRLARRLCERCKVQYQPEVSEMMAMRVGFDPNQHALPTLYRPVGCQQCSNTGYRGRIAVHEVMRVTEDIERLAVARASSAEIGHLAVEQGMLSLRLDGWMKIAAGQTSVDEIMRVVA